MNPPATPDAIARAEARFGVALAQDFRESLVVHDGQDNGGLERLGDWRLYDLESIARAWAMFVDMQREGTIEWRCEWIPIAGDGNGNHLVIDLVPGKEYGRVAWVPRLVERPSTIAPTFRQFLEDITNEIASGRFDERFASD